MDEACHLLLIYMAAGSKNLLFGTCFLQRSPNSFKMWKLGSSVHSLVGKDGAFGGEGRWMGGEGRCWGSEPLIPRPDTDPKWGPFGNTCEVLRLPKCLSFSLGSNINIPNRFLFINCFHILIKRIPQTGFGFGQQEAKILVSLNEI